MEYRNEQTKSGLRRDNNIRAFRILDIKDNSLIIRNPRNWEQTLDCATVQNPNAYKVGDYIDVTVNKTGTSSYSLHFYGKTPAEFIPTTGGDIGN